MRARRKSKGKTPKRKSASLVCPLGTTQPLRRSKRNAVKKPPEPKPVTLATYVSPLQHLLHNGPEKSSMKSSTVKKEVTDEKSKKNITTKVDNNNVLNNSVKEELDDEFSNLTFDFLNCSSLEKEEISNRKNKEDTTIVSSINDTPQTKKTKTRKRKSIHELIRTGEKINCSNKKKLKNKSLLSKFRETPEPNNMVDESVIVLDDSDSENLPTKPWSNEHKQNIKSNGDCSNQDLEKSDHKLLSNKSTHSTKQNYVKQSYFEYLKDHIESVGNDSVVQSLKESSYTQSMTNNDDIIVVDCNDSLQTEMDDYHKKFNQSTNSVQLCSDSVIILDADDEPPVPKENNKIKSQPTRQEDTPKTSEDCFVVWSSVPSTSKTETFLRPQPLFDSNSDILKEDKILIDTSPNMSNYRFLNNENNKPKKKVMKASKVNTRSSKHSPLKSILDKTKDIARRTAKSAEEVANKVASKSDDKHTEKTSSCKRKNKNNEDLIFLLDKGDGQTDAKKPKKGKLREIVIDGSNVGMAYTHNNIFSEKGIQLLINYFTKKGHTIKVFIPQYRRSYNYPLLEKWYKEGIVVFTPSRKIGNKHFTPYDDRYILEYATACGGVVVSQDQFRDLYREKPEYRDIIENRLLVPTFVGDYVMFPEDPLGREGPTLSNFLRH